MDSTVVTTDPSSSSSRTRRPCGKGRKKIEITKILDKNQQQVTFSKRRSGLFKKAAELCVQCSVEIAIITFSPGGKVFCFGHPNTEATMKRFLSGSSAAMDQNQAMVSQPWMGGDEAQIIQEYNCHYEQALQELEKEKRTAVVEKEKKKLKSSDNDQGLGFWWEEDVNVEVMTAEELRQYTAALEEMRSIVRKVESLKEAESCLNAVAYGSAPPQTTHIQL